MTSGVPDQQEVLVPLRRDLHAHPELAFTEHRTARIVVEHLERAGIRVVPGIAETGVVGSLTVGDSSRSIALRADMDALPIDEQNTFGHRSQQKGCMHACGHDGHVAMLLGAAAHLARTRRFDGTVYFIFQPGEENAGGARRMIDQGLFERFPADMVFGLHNVPGSPVGTFATRPGPLMAAIDTFEIKITGKGTHAAMPHAGVDPLVVAGELVLALQTIVARTLDPLEPAVVSATQIHGGDTWNVIPETVLLRGCIRYFAGEVGELLTRSMERIVSGVTRAHGASGELRFFDGYPPTVNTEAETTLAVAAARDLVGEGRVVSDVLPVMASEDFAYLLEKRPGCYMLIGNGDGENHAMVHSPHYDFNDAILTTGVAYWTRLVERILAAT